MLGTLNEPVVISNAPLTVQVYEHLRKKILQGILPPDSFLPSVRKLSTHFNVSSNVIFLALKRLHQEGLVFQLDNGRYRIRQAKPESAAELKRIGFCAHGADYIRIGVYQIIYNKLDRLCRDRGIILEPILNRSYEHSATTYDVLVVAGWKPENAEQICSGMQIRLDPWQEINADFTLGTDHHYGGWLLGQHLYRRGSRKVVYWNEIEGLSNNAVPMRALGFQKGWIEAGGSLQNVTFLPVFQEILPDLPALVAKYASQADAFCAYCDTAALRLWSELERQGFKVPEDLLLSGYDGKFEAFDHNPPLTTVRQNSEELAARIMDFCENPATAIREIHVPPILCQGAST